MNILKRFVVGATLSAALLAPSVAAPSSGWSPAAQAYPAGEPKWPRMRAGETNRVPVRTLQYLLRGRGYRVALDGNFGSQTVSAVKRFQRSRGLRADGSVGPQTWPLLCRTLRRGAKGDAVRALQVLLDEGGAADAPGQGQPIDGVFGAQTEDAVRQMKRAMVDGGDGMDIEINGVADAQLWAFSLQAANTHA